MYILEMNQAGNNHIVGLFQDKESAQDWIASCPYIQHEQFEVEGVRYDDYTMDYKTLPTYDEIKWRDSVFPLTKYMFAPDDGPIGIMCYELPVMEEVKGMVEGATQVDAYVIDNNEVKTYIEERENAKETLMEYFKKQNIAYEVGGQGSEDGEYIWTEQQLIHLDANFVDTWQNKSSVQAFVEEICR